MRFSRTLPKLFIAVCLTGSISCATRFEKETPAEEYPKLNEDMIGACPNITGIYTDAGHFTCSADAETCRLPSLTYGKYKHSEGYWVGSTSLTENLTEIDLTDIESIDPTELIQPDENTLVVVHGGVCRTLRRDEGDFECGPDGLVIKSGTHSMFDNAFMTTFAVFGLTWGIDSYTQKFTPHEDGSLSMTVKQFGHAFHVIIGHLGEWYYFVHWLPVEANDKKAPDK
jgi:hypothetical protein